MNPKASQSPAVSGKTIPVKQPVLLCGVCWAGEQQGPLSACVTVGFRLRVELNGCLSFSRPNHSWPDCSRLNYRSRVEGSDLDTIDLGA